MDADGFTTVRRSPAKPAFVGPGKPYVASAAKGKPAPAAKGKPYVAPAAKGKPYVAPAKGKPYIAPAPVTIVCTECSKHFEPTTTSCKYKDMCSSCIAHRQCVSCPCFTAIRQCMECGERVCAGCSIMEKRVICAKCYVPPLVVPAPEATAEDAEAPIVKTYVGLYNPARYGIVRVPTPTPSLPAVLFTEDAKDEDEGEWISTTRKPAPAACDDGYWPMSGDEDGDDDPDCWSVSDDD